MSTIKNTAHQIYLLLFSLYHFRSKNRERNLTMKTIRQRAFFRQWVIKEVAKGEKITKVAIKYRISRTSIYRWQKRYDGTVESLCKRSHRPHRHPNQHTEEELKLIKRVWSHNKGLGLVCLHMFLEMRHGYTRSVCSLNRAMKVMGIGRKKQRKKKYVSKLYGYA